MGGFAGLLGHAAAGFEQARQEDLSRQFADEQNRRAMAGELLHSIALDPNQHPDVRNAALQSYLGNVIQRGGQIGKPLDFGKVFQPIFDTMSKYRAAAVAAANAPPQQATPSIPLQLPSIPQPGQATVQAGGTHAEALPQGVAGPPQQVPNAPQINAPPRRVALANPSVLAPPPAPPPELLATVPEIAQNAGMVAAAQASGTLGGQLQVRREVAEGLMNDPKWGPIIQQDPMMRGMLLASMSGTNVPFGSMYRTQLAAGQSESGAALLNNPETHDAAVAQHVDPTLFYNTRKNPITGWEFASTAGRGQQAIGPGLLGSVGQVEETRQAAKLPFDLKKIGIRFGNSLALQQNAFQLAVNRNAMDQANAIFAKGQEDYLKRRGALQLMEDNYADALKGNQQAMVSMLFNHMGMTSGAVPGTRMTRAAVDEAQESANRIGLSVAKWFHQDATGDYIFDGPKGGVNLTKTQMDQMIELAKQRVTTQHAVVESMQNELAGQGEFQAPGVRAIGGGQAKPKAKTTKGGGPPAPPVGTVQKGYRFKGGNPADQASWEKVAGQGAK